MRPFVDSDYSELVRWFFVDDAPYEWGPYTRFGSGNFDGPYTTWPGTGEVLGAPRVYYHGARPFTPPIPGIAGDPVEYRDGAPFNARNEKCYRSVLGVPLPCAGGHFGLLWGGAGPFATRDAGLLFGGSSGFERILAAGDGGIEFDSQVPPGLVTGAGGAGLDGLVLPGVRVGEGGASLDARAGPAGWVGDGGLTLDGSPPPFILIANGGDVLDGRAGPGVAVGDGGASFDGVVPPGVAVGEGASAFDAEAFVNAALGDGGASVDGQAIPGLAVGDGGSQLDGDADASRKVGDGGAMLDGQALILLPLGQGGKALDAGVQPGVTVGDGGQQFDSRVHPGVTVGDGGKALNAEVKVNRGIGDGGLKIDGEARPGVTLGDGCLLLDGEVTPTSVAPGPACASAGPLPRAFVYSGTAPDSGSDWFYFDATAGNTYHVTLGGALTTGSCYALQGSCPDPSTELAIILPGNCGSFNAASTARVYLKITWGLIGPRGYTVSWDDGACP